MMRSYVIWRSFPKDQVANIFRDKIAIVEHLWIKSIDINMDYIGNTEKYVFFTRLFLNEC